MDHTNTKASFGYVGSKLVFMDIEADLYFTLDGPEAQEWVHSGERPVSMPTTDRSILDACARRQRLSPRILIEVAALLVNAKRTIAADRVSASLRSLTQSEPNLDTHTADAEQAAYTFAAARKLIPAAPHCLTDCIALIAWLRRRGAACTLVFGAKLDPFAAHCWVQAGKLLLSDRCEAVDRFTAVGIIECGRATR